MALPSAGSIAEGARSAEASSSSRFLGPAVGRALELALDDSRPLSLLNLSLSLSEDLGSCGRPEPSDGRLLSALARGDRGRRGEDTSDLLSVGGGGSCLSLGIYVHSCASRLVQGLLSGLFSVVLSPTASLAFESVALTGRGLRGPKTEGRRRRGFPQSEILLEGSLRGHCSLARELLLFPRATALGGAHTLGWLPCACSTGPALSALLSRCRLA